MNYYAIPGIRIKDRLKVKLETDQQAMERIIDQVCEVFHLAKYQIFQRCRRRERVLARQIAMFCIRKETGLSLKKIGERFGQDHTSVIHGTTTLQNLIDTRNPLVIRYMKLIDSYNRIIILKDNYSAPDDIDPPVTIKRPEKRYSNPDFVEEALAKAV